MELFSIYSSPSGCATSANPCDSLQSRPGSIQAAALLERGLPNSLHVFDERAADYLSPLKEKARSQPKESQKPCCNGSAAD